MGRRLLIGIAVILVLIGTGVSAYWYVLAQRLSDGFTAWTQARRAAGWAIQARRPSWRGWPVTARLVVPDFRIAGGEAEIPGGLSWSTEQLLLDLDLRHPAALILRSVGTQHVGGAKTPGFPYTARVMRATLSLTHPDAPAELAIRALRAGQNGLAVGAIDALVALNAAASSDQSAVAMTLTANLVELPVGTNWPLGPHIASLTTESALSGPVPPPSDPAHEAAAWRDAGGALHVSSLGLRWGPLDARLTGTLSLDRSLQPTAEGRVVASNYAPTLDALAAHRVMGNDAALAAKAVLSLLARAPQAGGPSQVEVPFTIHDRTVAAGGIPLTKLPELRWPGGS
ncbi:MAG TPA: DUF2125 domain-containing protein [Acetobacteraceae bacterium]|nr:DUF2125 domain-containing protein [Acetobacteraceae bacterium]